MLDLTDNLRGAEVITAADIIRRDGDDPYIVAAADKGTATFSDIANALSADYHFWLDDAFASGGSAGYDHKVMGITARGAWVMIERHFVETLGRSIHDAALHRRRRGRHVRRRLRQRAADLEADEAARGLRPPPHLPGPRPDPASSYAERARLFALPRSSWADYDAEAHQRGRRRLPAQPQDHPAEPEAQAMLGLEADRAEPATILQAILRMEADLLYFGGIGTYVKASTESQAEAGDRANDAIRIDGREIRAKVVGEGANLGVTQAGRIETARAGRASTPTRWTIPPASAPRTTR
jgi:glutamate dehydrogenase